MPIAHRTLCVDPWGLECWRYRCGIVPVEWLCYLGCRPAIQRQRRRRENAVLNPVRNGAFDAISPLGIGDGIGECLPVAVDVCQITMAIFQRGPSSGPLLESMSAGSGCLDVGSRPSP